MKLITFYVLNDEKESTDGEKNKSIMKLFFNLLDLCRVLVFCNSSKMSVLTIEECLLVSGFVIAIIC